MSFLTEVLCGLLISYAGLLRYGFILSENSFLIKNLHCFLMRTLSLLKRKSIFLLKKFPQKSAVFKKYSYRAIIVAHIENICAASVSAASAL